MRQEFSRKTLREALRRANGRCENIECQAVLKPGEGEGDHRTPCALGGDNSLANCQITCRVCHKAKTALDIGMIRKADRQRDRASGGLRSTSRPIPGSKASGLRKRMNGTVERRSP